jgi:hypothetical protein
MAFRFDIDNVYVIIRVARVQTAQEERTEASRGEGSGKE